MSTSYNFAAGPAMLPAEVMQQAQDEFIDFKDGMSAMEISHRQNYYLDVLSELEHNLTKLLNIPSNYKTIWTTGGATAQFSLIPLNLMGAGFSKNNKIVADYFCTGYWSNQSIKAASKYININKVVDNKEDNYTYIKSEAQWQFSENPLYVYYTPNETISGLRFNHDPDLKAANINAPLVADMTSCILSEPIDMSKYGIIFASAQKNLGPSGVTLMIIREDLLIDNTDLPDIFNYKKLVDKNSMLNTPPVYNMYLINLVARWLVNKGGLEEINKINLNKAQKLYYFIDNHELYYNSIVPEYRSQMNVTFNIDGLDSNPELGTSFLKQADQNGLHNLEGHRSIGGFRASIYNAMPMAGVDKLINFMADFAKKI